MPPDQAFPIEHAQDIQIAQTLHALLRDTLVTQTGGPTLSYSGATMRLWPRNPPLSR